MEAVAGSIDAGLEPRARALLRLAAQACAGHDPARIARNCAALRQTILDQCVSGTLTPVVARSL